jgi:Family of unknown function (DUF6519)
MEDISRVHFEPLKRYASVRLQQGRVTIEDDFNEAERIALEDARRVALDVIGPAGSPDGGFLPANGILGPTGLDFEIGAGTFYLGGLRLWNPTVQHYATQNDWLNQPASERLAPVDGRVDLVYLEAWQQPVSAVEDDELVEKALGGPDTSTRLRTMWRVRIATGVTGTDCVEAWRKLQAVWSAAHLGKLDATNERIVDTGLKVTYGGGVAGDLCTPTIPAGYLGAENQAIRVELVDATHFTWGFDNASPLYRATLGADRTTITLQSEPRDQAHWPRAGQIVELLPWSAVLSNGEKVASLRGHLARVASSWDPDTRQLKLEAASPVPVGFGAEWQSRSDKAALGAELWYLRVWDRGDDIVSDAAIAITGSPQALGSTGLLVTFSGTDRAADDHWIIAARPHTPDQVVPWTLEAGRSPHGVRRFYAPLALIRWTAPLTNNFVRLDVIDDCRPFFPPLTRVLTCCTYTVGDEVHSHGRFSSVQKAIDALPPEGGKICLLPGRWIENVQIVDRQNVVIEGCGARSVLQATERGASAIVIANSQGITLRKFAVEAMRGHAIDIDGKRKGRGWTLEDLDVTVRGFCAARATNGSELRILRSRLRALPLIEAMSPSSDVGRWPTVLSACDDVLIEENDIRAEEDGQRVPSMVGGPLTFARTALGGIQIAGGSERVEIRRNTIVSGNGDGITLGSWTWIRVDVGGDSLPWGELFPGGWTVTINEAGCIEVTWDPPHPNDPDGKWVPVSLGDLEDIRIIDNDILEMGKAGVGVARFFELKTGDVISVRGLLMDGNHIRGCLRLEVPPVPASLGGVAGAGAVCLAHAERAILRDNQIEGNGRSHIDPVCGVFALYATGLDIERNVIVDNAPRIDTTEPVRPGWRGGVVCPWARPPVVTVAYGKQMRATGIAAARVHGNVVVQPFGRALLIGGLGQMTVSDNELTSRGVIGARRGLASDLGALYDSLGGAVAFVLSLGMAAEGGDVPNPFGGAVGVPEVNGSGPLVTGGAIQFHDNIVRLDLYAGATEVVTAVALFSPLDDASIQDCHVETRSGTDDAMWADVVASALTTRVRGNRVMRGMNTMGPNGVLPWSIVATGSMCLVSANQTTWCISAPNAPPLQVLASDNAILNGVRCRRGDLVMTKVVEKRM